MMETFVTPATEKMLNRNVRKGVIKTVTLQWLVPRTPISQDVLKVIFCEVGLR